MKFTRDKRFWDEHEWGNRKPEWHWHAYRRHMVRRREQACDLASGSRWRRVKKLDAAQAPARQFARDLRVCDRPCEETRLEAFLDDSTTDEALQGSEEAFLSDVYRLVEENLSRKAIAQVFDFLDDKVLAADFEACDRILRAVDLDRLDASTALGFLSITTQVRDRLSHRNGLLQRIERHLLQQRSPEYVETLLRGLR